MRKKSAQIVLAALLSIVGICLASGCSHYYGKTSQQTSSKQEASGQETLQQDTEKNTDSMEEKDQEPETDQLQEQSIWEVMGQDACDWAEQFDSSQVKQLVYRTEGEQQEDYVIREESQIQQVFDALDEITVLENPDMLVSDAGDSFLFTMKDGSEVVIDFAMACLLYDKTMYETYQADDLWTLTGDIIGMQEEAQSEQPEESSDIPATETRTVQIPGEIYQDIPVIDNDYLLMKASSSDTDLSDGYTIQLQLINRSVRYLVVNLQASSINDYMVESDDWSSSGEEIPAGGTVTSEITWTAQNLEDAGIQRIDSITLAVKSYSRKSNETADSCIADTLLEMKMPEEENKEEADYTPFLQQKLIDNDDYTFGIVSCDQDDEEYPVWTVYMENHSEKAVSFWIRSGVLNGYALNPSWKCLVLPGKKALSQVSWWDLGKNAARLTPLTSADFTLLISSESEDGDVKVELRQKCSLDLDSVEAVETETEEDKSLVLYDSKRVGVEITKIIYSRKKGYCLLYLKLRNSSKKEVTFSSDSITLGETAGDPGWEETLPAGSKRKSILSISFPADKDAVSDVLNELGLDLTMTRGKTEVSLSCRINPSKFLLIHVDRQ